MVKTKCKQGEVEIKVKGTKAEIIAELACIVKAAFAYEFFEKDDFLHFLHAITDSMLTDSIGEGHENEDDI